jgi:hypothetical protein
LLTAGYKCVNFPLYLDYFILVTTEIICYLFRSQQIPSFSAFKANIDRLFRETDSNLEVLPAVSTPSMNPHNRSLAWPSRALTDADYGGSSLPAQEQTEQRLSKVDIISKNINSRASCSSSVAVEVLVY